MTNPTHHLIQSASGLMLGLIVGCSSGPVLHAKVETTMIPDLDHQSSAHGAAYTADSMHFRKPMPSRPSWKPMEFYFKHCQEIGEASYFSLTSYQCSSP